jgi:glycosyltransferase involved in cell wall biosynthesis
MKRALMFASVASMIDQFNMDNIHILQELGYKVDVACNFEFGSTTSQERVIELKKELGNIGVNIYQIPVPRKITSVKEMVEAYKLTKNLVKKNKYEIVHCHSPIGGVIARLACKNTRKEGTKVIYTAHGFHFYKGASKLNWMLFYPIERYCAKFTDTLITINKEDYKRSKKFKADNIVYVPGVGIRVDEIDNVQVNTELKRIELGISKNEHMVLSVGELNDNKNHEVIVKAVAKITTPIKYVICGKGDKESYLKNLAKELGIEEKVIFAGYRSDVKEILKSTDIFCLPSKREGLSVALMEALAAGLPCVASRIRGNVDLIQSAKGGYLVDSMDVNGFKGSFEKLISDKGTRDSFGDFNRSFIRKFDRENVKDYMLKIYRKGV